MKQSVGPQYGDGRGGDPRKTNLATPRVKAGWKRLASRNNLPRLVRRSCRKCKVSGVFKDEHDAAPKGLHSL